MVPQAWLYGDGPDVDPTEATRKGSWKHGRQNRAYWVGRSGSLAISHTGFRPLVCAVRTKHGRLDGSAIAFFAPLELPNRLEVVLARPWSGSGAINVVGYLRLMRASVSLFLSLYAWKWTSADERRAKRSARLFDQ